MTITRNERTVGQADPTVTVNYEIKAGNIGITLTEFFGDVTSRVTWKGRQLLFTSPFTHKWLNKLATCVHEELEAGHNRDLMNEETVEYGLDRQYF